MIGGVFAVAECQNFMVDLGWGEGGLEGQVHVGGVQGRPGDWG